MAAVQYKIMGARTVEIDRRANCQITRLENVFCKDGFCICPEGKNRYRLPYCAAFFRPTEAIQADDPRIISRGFYVPICAVRQLQAEYPDTHNFLSKYLRSSAITHKIFEELFNTKMLGSDWVSYERLKEVYIANKILEPKDTITIYAQEYN